MARWIIIWIAATAILCYISFQKGQLDIIGDDLELFGVYIEAAQEKDDHIERLEKRIDAMQEVIDYNEGIIHNAINGNMTSKKALEYIEKHYVVWDEVLYRAQERMDELDEMED